VRAIDKLKVARFKSLFKIKTFEHLKSQKILLKNSRRAGPSANMAPSIAILPSIRDVAAPKKDTLGLPEASRARLEKAGIDLSEGYPYRPARPLYYQDVYNIRNKDRTFVDAGSRADKSKSALLSAASKVTDLTTHIGTEIEGLQLQDLSAQQKDELGLLIAERSVVFFRNQDITPQQQKALGEWYGEVEIHVRISLPL
jgi:hypothetical protein